MRLLGEKVILSPSEQKAILYIQKFIYSSFNGNRMVGTSRNFEFCLKLKHIGTCICHRRFEKFCSLPSI